MILFSSKLKFWAEFCVDTQKFKLEFYAQISEHKVSFECNSNFEFQLKIFSLNSEF